MADNKKPNAAPVVKVDPHVKTKARKTQNVAKNEARNKANLAELGVVYNPNETRTKTVSVTKWNGKGFDTQVRTRQVPVPPSKQLRQLRRLQNGVTK